MKGTSVINKVCETNVPSSTPPRISVGDSNIQCPTGSSEISGIL